MFGRATIRLGIGPHSGFSCFTWLFLLELLQVGYDRQKRIIGIIGASLYVSYALSVTH